MTRFVKKYSIGFVFSVLLFGCQTIPTSEYSGSSEDLNLLISIKNNAKEFSSERSILWVEKGYLSQKEKRGMTWAVLIEILFLYGTIMILSFG